VVVLVPVVAFAPVETAWLVAVTVLAANVCFAPVEVTRPWPVTVEPPDTEGALVPAGATMGRETGADGPRRCGSG
jgi:hypothetical protein